MLTPSLIKPHARPAWAGPPGWCLPEDRQPPPRPGGSPAIPRGRRPALSAHAAPRPSLAARAALQLSAACKPSTVTAPIMHIKAVVIEGLRVYKDGIEVDGLSPKHNLIGACATAQ